MLIKTKGIIFRAIKYGETSLILEVYTRSYGRRSYIISGVRKAKSKIAAGLVRPMSLVDIVAYERPGKELTRLKEVQPAIVYQSLPFEVVKGAVGLFILEVTRNAIREAEDNPALFDFLFEAFEFLDQTRDQIVWFHHHFLLELTAYLGFLPAGEFTSDTPYFDLREGKFVEVQPLHSDVISGAKAETLHLLLFAQRSNLHDIQADRKLRVALLDNLLQYYHLHLEGMQEVKSLDVLREVMS